MWLNQRQAERHSIPLQPLAIIPTKKTQHTQTYSPTQKIIKALWSQKYRTDHCVSSKRGSWGYAGDGRQACVTKWLNEN